MVYRVLRLVVLMALFLGVAPSLAQGDMTTFTSPDGTLSFDYPSQITLVDDANGGYLFSNVAGYDGSDLPDEMSADELVLGVIPPGGLGDFEDRTPSEVVSLLGLGLGGTETVTVETLTINDRPAAHAITPTVLERPTLNLWLMVIDFDGEYVILMSVYTQSAAATYTPVLLAVAESLTYGRLEPVSLDNLVPITAENASALIKVQDYSDNDHELYEVALSADASLMAVAYYDYADNTNYIDVLVTATGEVVNSIPFEGLIRLLYMDADGHIVYRLEGDPNGVTVVDANSGEVVETRYPADSAFQLFTVGADLVLMTSRLASDDRSRQITVYHTTTDAVLLELTLAREAGTMWAINADASQFLMEREGTLYLFNTADSTEVMVYAIANNPPLENASFSPDGQSVAVADYDGGLYVFDTATQALIGTQTQDGAVWRNLQFSPDNRLLYSSVDADVWVFDATTLEPLSQVAWVTTNDPVKTYRQAANGQFLVGGGYITLAIMGVAAE